MTTRAIPYAIALLLLLVAGGCERKSLIKDEINISEVIGCYTSPGLPTVKIYNDRIYFGDQLLTQNYYYEYDGRTANKIISIRPRVYLTKYKNAFSQVMDLPQGYSAIFAFIKDGQQGESIELNYLFGENPVYRKNLSSECSEY